jgi:hypothetical protein
MNVRAVWVATCHTGSEAGCYDIWNGCRFDGWNCTPGPRRRVLMPRNMGPLVATSPRSERSQWLLPRRSRTAVRQWHLPGSNGPPQFTMAKPRCRGSRRIPLPELLR